ncbi:hypothetical protein R6Q59_011614, partial [Mikania micrantha]
MRPTPTLGEAYRVASEDEQQRNITAMRKPHVEGAAFQINAGSRRDGSSNQHRNKSNQKQGKQNTTYEADHCTHCGKNGHTRDGCFERIGYPEWWPSKAKRKKSKPKASCVETEQSAVEGLTEQQYQALLKHFTNPKENEGDETRRANMAGKFIKGDEWIIDSGSTEHIIGEPHLLEDYVENKNEIPVIIPNGDKIPVKAKGTCTLTKGTQIKGVLYIPSFNCNLLSVSRLARDLNCS